VEGVGWVVLGFLLVPLAFGLLVGAIARWSGEDLDQPRVSRGGVWDQVGPGCVTGAIAGSLFSYMFLVGMTNRDSNHYYALPGPRLLWFFWAAYGMATVGGIVGIAGGGRYIGLLGGIIGGLLYLGPVLVDQPYKYGDDRGISLLSL